MNINANSASSERPRIAADYRRFALERYAPGSNTAASYVTAIDILTDALKRKTDFLAPGESVWDVRDLDRLELLHEFIRKEQRKPDGGIFSDTPRRSYWEKGFCSAAIKDFGRFLAISGCERNMLASVERAEDAGELSRKLTGIKLPATPLLLDDAVLPTSSEGRMALRETKVRLNQSVFRKMILMLYSNRCCLTGLPLCEVLRASHISPWSRDKNNRMNPENGLCLSATYDAAFDRHLISFDEDFRMILAPSLRDYCTNEAFRSQFLRLEGRRIELPRKFPPSQKLLAAHRERMQ